jgi:uncharacterized Zn finger protein
MNTKNPIGETLPTEEDNCPHCGYAVDEIIRMAREQKEAKPGDLTVCLNCGEFGQFNEQMKLEKCSDEVAVLLGLSDETRMLVVRAREIIKQRGKI